jgi:hypothetical protein
MKVNKPGIYEMTSEEYHADPCPEPSLSCTGIKRLLEDRFGGCPANFKYLLDHPQPFKQAWNFGKAAHRVLLGKGEEIVISPYDEFRTKEAKAFRDETRASGKTLMKASEMVHVEAMATAARVNPKIDAAFSNGQAELVIVWYDDVYKVWCRAMLDYWNPAGLVPDYKSCLSANYFEFKRAVWRYGYDIQSAFYREGVKAWLEKRPPRWSEPGA